MKFIKEGDFDLKKKIIVNREAKKENEGGEGLGTKYGSRDKKNG